MNNAPLAAASVARTGKIYTASRKADVM